MDVTAPYNFVPLSALVARAEDLDDALKDLPSQDDPIPGGLSGCLEVEIAAHTPILVGAGTDSDGIKRFVRVPEGGPEGTPAIPGSSWRGMLRNVLEIAAFGRMVLVDDARTSVRDLTASARLDYGDRFTEKRNGSYAPKTRAGWLKIENGTLQLTPCEFARIQHRELNKRDLSPGFTDRLAAAEARFKEHRQASDDIKSAGVVEAAFLNGRDRKALERSLYVQDREIAQPLVFRKAALEEASAIDDQPVTASLRQGTLVFTGISALKKEGRSGSAGRGATSKTKEFFFYDQAPSAMSVDEQVWGRFIAVHEGQEKPSETWKWRRAALYAGEAIPVFWLPDGKGGIDQIGLAMMFKLAASASIGEMIGHTHADHRDANLLDLPTRLFGRIGSTTQEGSEREGFRTRVSFGWAIAVAGSWQERANPYAFHLQKPKPSFTPAYVRQRDFANASGTRLLAWSEKNTRGDRTTVTAQYRSYMHHPDKRVREEIRGWKRYPVRPWHDDHPQASEGEVSRMAPLVAAIQESPVRFTARLRYHNLHPIELGALVWALTFGGRPGLRHALGMGKPLGWGQVALSLPGMAEHQVADLMRPFVEAMEHWAVRQQLPNGWAGSVQICQLMAMADPEKGHTYGDMLKQMRLVMDGPNDFKEAKKELAVLPEYGLHTVAAMLDSVDYETIKRPRRQPIDLKDIVTAVNRDLETDRNRQAGRLRAAVEAGAEDDKLPERSLVVFKDDPSTVFLVIKVDGGYRVIVPRENPDGKRQKVKRAQLKRAPEGAA